MSEHHTAARFDQHTSAEEPAHDILAAEAFAVPTADPSLHHQPVVLPDDPSGIAEPHDVLAAEEFAMPAAHHSALAGSRPAAPAWRAGAVAGALGFLVARLLRRR
jgi:hypothetical protein